MYTWANRLGRPVIPNRVRGVNNTRGLSFVPGTVFIGRGEHGMVNMYMNASKRKYARKVQTNGESLLNEIALMRKIKKIVPSSVPTVYPSNKNKLITEYIHGGDFESWVRKHRNHLTQGDFELMILQVLKILDRISKRDPTFRHNDLHCGNILVDDDKNTVRLVLTDFGLSWDAQYPSTETDIAWIETLKKAYGIFKGNHKLYDALTFLQSVSTLKEIDFPGTKRKIRTLLLGIPLIHGRPAYNAHIHLTFSDLLRAFSPRAQPKTRSNAVMNLNAGFFKTPVNPLNQIRALRVWAQGKTLQNKAKANLRSMFPNIKNVNFQRIVGFIPKKPTKKNVNLPKGFATPMKLKNVATLGASRFKTKNIKKASPKVQKSPVRKPKVWSPKPYPLRVSLKNTRPVNIEHFFKKMGKPESNARQYIEMIIRNGRSGKLQAWEKAQLVLGNQISISSSSSSSPKA